MRSVTAGSQQGRKSRIAMPSGPPSVVMAFSVFVLVFLFVLVDMVDR